MAFTPLDFIASLAALNQGDVQGFREPYSREGRANIRARRDVESQNLANQRAVLQYFNSLPPDQQPAAIANLQALSNLNVSRAKEPFTVPREQAEIGEMTSATQARDVGRRVVEAGLPFAAGTAEAQQDLLRTQADVARVMSQFAEPQAMAELARITSDTQGQDIANLGAQAVLPTVGRRAEAGTRNLESRTDLEAAQIIAQMLPGLFGSPAAGPFQERGAELLGVNLNAQPGAANPMRQVYNAFLQQQQQQNEAAQTVDPSMVPGANYRPQPRGTSAEDLRRELRETQGQPAPKPTGKPTTSTTPKKPATVMTSVGAARDVVRGGRKGASALQRAGSATSDAFSQMLMRWLFGEDRVVPGSAGVSQEELDEAERLVNALRGKQL